MGTYVFVVGRHGLNISTVEELAKDLSQIFQKEIDIGYVEEFCLNSKGKIDYTHNYEYKSITNNTRASIRMYDVLYPYRMYIQQYGLEKAKKMFKSTIFYDSLLTASKPYLGIEIFDIENDMHIGDIYNDIFVDHISDYGYSWWVFCQVFNGEDDYEYYVESVIKFRKEVKQYLSAFRVNEVFYLRDDHFANGDIDESCTWASFIESLQKNYSKKDIANVCDLIRTGKLLRRRKKRSKDVYIYYYPEAFYDNFEVMDYPEKPKKPGKFWISYME